MTTTSATNTAPAVAAVPAAILGAVDATATTPTPAAPLDAPVAPEPVEPSESGVADAPPSFADRRRRAEARATAAPPTPAAPNVWEHQAEQRRLAAKGAKSDIGYHRPSMAQLAPVLALAASPSVSGRELFEAFETALPPPRPIVAHIRMDAGYHTSQIDEGKALRAVLHDNRIPGIDAGLAEIVQLTVDSNSRQLIWGLASFEAVKILENKTFKIPTKDGTQDLTMKSEHVLDGFYVDFVGFAVDREAKAHLWDVLHAAGATPVSGIYTNSSEAFGATGSRYRVSFAGASVPPLFQVQGRLIDEVVFIGKCYRVYGKDWYNHRKQTQRVDLDIRARELRIPGPGSSSSCSKSPSTKHETRGSDKRQRVDPDEPLSWTIVTKGATAAGASTKRPWTSPNVYQALDDHFNLSTKTVTTANGADLTILPVVLARPDAPLQLPADTFVGGTKAHRNKPVRVEVPLPVLLDEFAALDVAAAAAATTFELHCSEAGKKTTLDLAKYVESGEADWIQRDLEDHPVVFRRELQDLALAKPHLLLPLVQLRLLNRWMRACVGAATPFHKLYSNVFGHRFSLDVLAHDFGSLLAASDLDASACPEAAEPSALAPVEVEVILALSELVLGSTAPLFYRSDAALYKVAAQPVFSIPSRFKTRYVATATLRHTLWGSTALGASVWNAQRALLKAAVDVALTSAVDQIDSEPCSPLSSVPTANTAPALRHWLAVMDVMERLEDDAALNVEPTNQVMLDAASGRLVHGDLSVLWTDFAAAMSG